MRFPGASGETLPSRVAAFLFVLAILVGGPAPDAAAAEGDREKVLGLQIEGSALSARDRAELLKVVQTKLRAYPSLDLVQAPESELTDLMIEVECIEMDAACLSRLGERYGATRVFLAQVSEAEDGWAIRVRIVAVDSGETLRDRATSVQTREELADRLERDVEAVFGPPPPPAPETGILLVISEVPGARIFVNGEYAGTGRVELDKVPGTYGVRVTHDGFEEALLEVPVEVGETARRTVALNPIPVAAPPPPAPRDDDEPLYKKWWLWTVVGAVAAAGVVGGVMAAGGADGGGAARGSVQLSVDPADAWRDSAILGRSP